VLDHEVTMADYSTVLKLSERVITVWNELSVSTDFSPFTRFKGSILDADFSDYIVCFKLFSVLLCIFFVFCVCF